ncbi:MAG: ABC transporter ATP-binding protein [Calditerrivibrio sp.]|nr:ABC transporter ATP-binding protein [Calditerrivibrio sp.]
MLKVDNISISFGGLKALSNVSFSISNGINALIGPNGAGKTTLFNVVSGFLVPTEGKIFFKGEDITGQPPYKIFSLGISRTFQNLNLIKEATLRENLYLGILEKEKPSLLKDMMRLNKSFWKRIDEKIDEVMELTGVKSWQHLKPESAPYGVLKNFELARALVSNPILLLLDEPAAGLNNTEKESLGVLLEKIAQTGIDILMVEHDMTFVSSLAKYVVCLNFGKVIAMGSYLEIRQNDEVIRAYLGDLDA